MLLARVLVGARETRPAQHVPQGECLLEANAVEHGAKWCGELINLSRYARWGASRKCAATTALSGISATSAATATGWSGSQYDGNDLPNGIGDHRNADTPVAAITPIRATRDPAIQSMEDERSPRSCRTRERARRRCCSDTQCETDTSRYSAHS